MRASDLVQSVQERQEMTSSCPEEIAYRMGFIAEGQLRFLANIMGKNGFGEYLRWIIDE